MVSYSLYLVHVPLGGRVVNLMTRFADGVWQLWAISLLATGFSLIVAWLFWRWVEVPSQRWSCRWKRSTAP
jgi:peptidoglycan/LPS O-acetylase OafA/YrhL